MEEPAAQFPPNHLLAWGTQFPPNHLLAPSGLRITYSFIRLFRGCL
ncbi:MAG: hypothetical protein HYW48_04185 [Deltaproteobacteria bacterium]|nr:hypothetical protein [Deltaproteobacteria bacterium]